MKVLPWYLSFVGTSTRIGEVLASKYRLDEELGRGGMGAVYRAFHLLVRKDFAVKVLNSEIAEHRSVAQRFLLEAQAAGRIGHPGILEVYDIGEDADGRPFMVMELLHGESLASLLARRPLDIDASCWIAIKILEVLEAAHASGVIHRDVKPQNVFTVVPADTKEASPRSIKLLDFGIAKFAESDASAITRSGEIIGSPLYMAPEQAKGESQIDARVDVWSTGALLFEMLTGAAAHMAPTPVAVLAKILTVEAPPPSSKRAAIPPELDEVVKCALRIDREARFSSARDMRVALEAVRRSRAEARTVPTFPPLEARSSAPATVRGHRLDDAEVVRTTELAEGLEPPPPRSSEDSVEPAMEAAVTNRSTGATRKRPLVAVAAAVLVAGAAFAFVRGTPSASPPTAEAVSAAAIEAGPRVLPSSAPSAVPSVTSEIVDASAVVEAPRYLDAGAKRRTPDPTPISKPACASGEVASEGHCCPRGLVWQAGRCERPLATSF